MTVAGELQQLLSQFAKRYQFATPQLGGDGRCALLLDGDLEVMVLQGGNRIYLEAQVLTLPTDQRQVEELLVQCLHLHLTRLQDKQEVLSVDPEGNDLVLFRPLPALGLTLVDFEQALESFVNSLEFWTANTSGTVASWTAVPLPASQILFP